MGPVASVTRIAIRLLRVLSVDGISNRNFVDDLIQVLTEPEADPVAVAVLGHAFGDAREKVIAVGGRPPIAQRNE